MDRLPLAHIPTGDQAQNVGMCPNWESNQRTFGAQDNVQLSEPHWPGQGWLALTYVHSLLQLLPLGGTS